MIHLLNADPEKVKVHFPYIFSEDYKYFVWIAKDHIAAVYGIKHINDESCELCFGLFDGGGKLIPHKYGIKLFFDNYLVSKYTNLMVSSVKRSVVRLLFGCKRYGVQFLKKEKNRYWFVFKNVH